MFFSRQKKSLFMIKKSCIFLTTFLTLHVFKKQLQILRLQNIFCKLRACGIFFSRCNARAFLLVSQKQRAWSMDRFTQPTPCMHCVVVGKLPLAHIQSRFPLPKKSSGHHLAMIICLTMAWQIMLIVFCKNVIFTGGISHRPLSKRKHGDLKSKSRVPNPWQQLHDKTGGIWAQSSRLYIAVMCPCITNRRCINPSFCAENMNSFLLF